LFEFANDGEETRRNEVRAIVIESDNMGSRKFCIKIDHLLDKNRRNKVLLAIAMLMADRKDRLTIVGNTFKPPYHNYEVKS